MHSIEDVANVCDGLCVSIPVHAVSYHGCPFCGKLSVALSILQNKDGESIVNESISKFFACVSLYILVLLFVVQALKLIGLL